LVLPFIAAAVSRPDSVVAAELPGLVREALERNAAALVTLTVRWEERRSSPLLPSELVARLNSTDRTLLEPRQGRLIRDGSRAYCSFISPVQVEGKLATNYSEVSYDGAYLYVGNHQRKEMGEPVLLIERIEKARRDMADWRVLQIDYFHQAGFTLAE